MNVGPGPIPGIRVVPCGKTTMALRRAPVAECVAAAKRDLEPGENIDGQTIRRCDVELDERQIVVQARRLQESLVERGRL